MSSSCSRCHHPCSVSLCVDCRGGLRLKVCLCVDLSPTSVPSRKSVLVYAFVKYAFLPRIEILCECGVCVYVLCVQN